MDKDVKTLDEVNTCCPCKCHTEVVMEADGKEDLVERSPLLNPWPRPKLTGLQQERGQKGCWIWEQGLTKIRRLMWVVRSLGPCWNKHKLHDWSVSNLQTGISKQLNAYRYQAVQMHSDYSLTHTTQNDPTYSNVKRNHLSSVLFG